MGLFFGRGKGGGLMNVIRCNQEEYLVWKWRPEGQAVDSTTRENAIRYGSSLRVRDGELAVFVYKQKDGSNMDFIMGPFDKTIKTANFPVLSSIVGLAYGGESPFQAEIYFINLQKNNQVRFAVPFFDIFDNRLPDHGVPVAVRGTLTFNISDYMEFIKLNRLIDFDLDQFLNQIKSALVKYIKGIVMEIPSDMGIPVVQIESRILQINQRILSLVKPRLECDFGVNVRNIDISAIDIDRGSPYYQELRELTAGQTAKTITAQTDINIKNLEDTQRINSVNMEETLRIQREEAQRAQKLQSETNFIGAHTINRQADVLMSAANNLGSMASMGGGGGDGDGGGGMNPAGMMTGMMMGGAIGQQMAGMMGNMGQQMTNAMNTPPPPPAVQYMVSFDGQASGPYTLPRLMQLAAGGQVTPQTYVWKQGMTEWEMAGNVTELQSIFMPTPPQATPPGMPTPPAP